MIKINSSFVSALALSGWIILSFVPYFSMSSYEQYARVLNDGPPVIYQAFGVVAFCTTVFLLRPVPTVHAASLLRVGDTRSFFLWFCIYTGTLSLWSIDPYTSLMFTLLHMAVFSCFVSLWRMGEEFDRMLPYVGICILIAVAGLGLALGLRERSFGFVPPNNIAKLVMLASVFCIFGSRRLMRLGVVIALALITLTQSRGTLLAYLIFWQVYLIGTNSGRSIFTWTLFGVSSVILILMFDLLWADGAYLQRSLEAVFLLSDPVRGAGSGLTGRLDHWVAALSVISESPVFGYGLRTRGPFTVDPVIYSGFNAHSGYLNMIMDLGMVGAVALVWIFVRHIWKLKPDPASGANIGVRRRAVARAYLVAALFLWALEPLYIDIGAPFGLAALLFLAVPCSTAGNIRKSLFGEPHGEMAHSFRV